MRYIMTKKINLINSIIANSKIVIGISFVALIACILISYPYAEHFSMPVQIGAHISTILLAGVFKVAIVGLMAATKELQNLTENTEVAATFATA